MRASSPKEVPLSAAQALKEEYARLGRTLPADYHAWLLQLPDLPRLWLLQPSHFIEGSDFTCRLREAGSPLLRFLFHHLSPDSVRLLGECRPRAEASDDLFEAIAEDLNRLIGGGQPIFSEGLFEGVVLSAETRSIARESPTGKRLEILNRLLLEEAFPDAIRRVWDTQGGALAILRAQPRTALCLSGGGIRSATFALGVLQGLARHDLLGQFDYLSTVSGGGYIGSWLSSWIHHARDPRRVFDEIKNVVAESPSEPEPRELRHLRAFSNYLTPRLGTFSADTWTLVGTYLRNLLLNWLVFLPLIAAALAIPRIGVGLLQWTPQPWLTALAFASGCAMTICGITYGALQRPSVSARLAERSRFWSCRSGQMDFLIYGLLPLWLASICFTIFWAWLPKHTFRLPPWWLLATGGAVLHVLGWLTSRWVLGEFRFRELAAVIVTGALGGLAVWLPARETFRSLRDAPGLEFYVCFASPVFIIVFLLMATLFIGLSSRRTSDADREWWAREGAWLLIVVVGWSAFSALTLFGPPLLVGLFAISPLLTSLGGVPGVLTLVVGYRSQSTPNKQANVPRTWRERLPGIFLALAAPLFIAVLAALIALGTSALLSLWPGLEGLSPMQLIHRSPVWLTISFVAAAAGFGLVMSWLININKFTLHSVYRNRLIRAYLGASNPSRTPNAFTGFDPKDNLRLCQLEGQRPFHVVNMALNLVSGDNLAWQQRKAETFTASALHAGNARLGYRRAGEYALNEDGQGLSLGTAVTISGAAASPNMGYHSSPIIAALMTLFNVRLGAWLGNPGRAGDRTYRDPAPRSAALHMLKEAFGLTDSNSGYVYLSDGGHFENLGLYEMVLRRCSLIVVSDGGCDADCRLEDLGNAIRKIRVDLGVPIELRQFDIHSRKDGEKGRHCAVGEILYDRVDGPQASRGTLIYIKPSITGDEPRDIFNYKETSPQFPHEPTSDQWFSESQFESYRMLGLHTVTEMCQDWSRSREQRPEINPLALFARQTYKYLDQAFPPDVAQRVESLPPDLNGGGASTRAGAPNREHETKLIEQTQSF